MEKRLEGGQPGNINAVRHGGRAAVKRLQDGGNFTGPAKDKQDVVLAELANDGVNAIIERNAIRLQVCTDLYFDALVKAAQDGNAAMVDSYAARYGWLAGKTLQAWRDVNVARRNRPAAALDAVLEDYENDTAGE